jgi:hypothetical protein
MSKRQYLGWVLDTYHHGVGSAAQLQPELDCVREAQVLLAAHHGEARGGVALQEGLQVELVAEGEL